MSLNMIVLDPDLLHSRIHTFIVVNNSKPLDERLDNSNSDFSKSKFKTHSKCEPFNLHPDFSSNGFDILTAVTV